LETGECPPEYREQGRHQGLPLARRGGRRARVFGNNDATKEAAMSTSDVGTDDTAGDSRVRNVDLKIEAVVIPVSDVNRAEAFYASLGWLLDADLAFDNGFRVVQVTPPGSAESLYLVVSDIEAARAELVARGVEVSEVFAAEPGAQFRSDGSARAGGPAPDHATYGSFATFSDPDGNRWLLQEVTTRHPGRVARGRRTRQSPT